MKEAIRLSILFPGGGYYAVGGAAVLMVPITLALIERLLGRYPGIVAGVKDSSGEWPNTQAMLERFKDRGFDVFAGSEVFLLDTMRHMLACFRPDDVAATMKTVEEKKVIERSFIACYGGEYDIGHDKVWDVWQIEGPEMVWYFRGQPHIHGYFHLAA